MSVLEAPFPRMTRVTDIHIPPYLDGTPDLRGVLGVPDGGGPWPGVVMVHEAFGVDDVMRRQVERMASAGYLVLMPDLYSAGGVLRCLMRTFRALADGQGRAFMDVEAARRYLLERTDCTRRVGVLGFCMGGRFALVAAARGFDVASDNYGQLPPDLEDTLTGACPIVASYGRRDTTMTGAAARLEETLTRLGIEHDVREYPDAGHSFLNDAEVGPRLLRPIMRIAGAGPNPTAAADAWRRIEAFFQRHLAN
jgi:carboxymethylenebutenolidase